MVTPAADPTPLERRLGHRFADPVLLERALTHRSAGSRNNERLEFLGDAVLGLVIADLLYARFPEADEGDLSRLRAHLVNRTMLASLARELDLGEHIRLGSGELKSGGRRRDSILADAFEAVLGALYLDAGYARVAAVIRRLFEPRLADLQTGVPKDPKTRLQEHLQALGRPLPRYEVCQVEGEAHRQRFRVACRLEDEPRVTEGEGTSRRRAEQAAAERMLAELGG
ncbi:MAG: ribonuclease III [Gammaproteobacteria bacterium]|nr:MAG: ribonuclease III [Gammaproteobacteria bacterium]